VPPIGDFLKDVDRRWAAKPSGKIVLRIIGSAALMLQTGYERGTKDSDVLETDVVTDAVRGRLLELGGAGTELHHRHRLYIDIVARGLPFLPQVPLCHRLVDLNRALTNLEFEVLDVVDVVVSKLKRFNANDVDDIRAMVDRDLIVHRRLVARFRSAVDVFSGDARAEELPTYVSHLHRVERDFLNVPESKIDLPDWI
jgi:hypothetical protein